MGIILPTNIIQKTFKIFDGRVGRDSPDRIKFTLKEFGKIHYAELKINLGAKEGIPLFQWKLTKLVLNGFTFHPSGGIQSVNIVHQSKTACGNLNGCLPPLLKAGENVLFVHHDSPFGSGTPLVPDIFMDANLLVVGEPEINPIKILGNSGTDLQIGADKVIDDFKTFIDKNTIPTIIILIVLAIIIIGTAYILFKTGGIVSDVQQGTSDVKEITS